MAHLVVRREEAAPFVTKKYRTRASCYVVLWVLLAIAFCGQARAWTGQPLAYVTSSNGISVIDTGDNKVIDTIPGPALPAAVTPDGKHLYAFASDSSDLLINISVIDTSNDEVVATIPLNISLVAGGVSLDEDSHAIAVSPDGKQVYITTGLCSNASFDCTRPESVYYALWVIDTATNKVVSAVPGKGFVQGIAFSPDGKHAYYANYDSDVLLPQVLTDSGLVSLPGNGSVSAIAITPDGKDLYVPYVDFNGTSNPPETLAIVDTTMNLVKTLLVEPASFDTTLTGVCVTPDGQHVYVTDQESNTVSVIDTASNTIVKTVSVGAEPSGVAVTPDGLHVYVSNQGSDSVSVIDTASNTVVDTILSVTGPTAISIMSRPLGVPFLVFDAKLDIDLDRHLRQDFFELGSSFILNSNGGNRIHPETEPVKLQVGPFVTTIPAGSFKRREGRSYAFEGVINGVHLRAKIELLGGFRYTSHVEAKGANLNGTTNPVQISLGIGNDTGLTSVKAHFDRDHHAHGYWTDEWR